MATVETLITAEEFGAMPDDGRCAELVRGRIVEMPPPRFRHGSVCVRVSRLLGNHAEEHDLGHVLGGDVGIVTERDPDTLRGADVVFISYARWPRERVADEYLNIAPELVIEVRSPSDRRGEVEEKVAEYLAAGVLIVCVLDPQDRSAWVHSGDRPPVLLGPDAELVFPGWLGDFRIIVRSLFEK